MVVELQTNGKFQFQVKICVTHCIIAHIDIETKSATGAYKLHVQFFQRPLGECVLNFMKVEIQPLVHDTYWCNLCQ